MPSTRLNTRKRILTTTWHLMEQHRGQNVHMRDIADAVGISRQALYLHFASRTELMIATVQYVDEVKGLHERLKHFQVATTGIELLDICVDFWGNYIPEIYGLAKALLNTRETDEATATAWNGCLRCLNDTCREIIETLDREGILAPEWPQNEAIEMLQTLLSIYHWEQLTLECGWSTTQYIGWMKTLLKRTFVAHIEVEKEVSRLPS